MSTNLCNLITFIEFAVSYEQLQFEITYAYSGDYKEQVRAVSCHNFVCHSTSFISGTMIRFFSTKNDKCYYTIYIISFIIILCLNYHLLMNREAWPTLNKKLISFLGTSPYKPVNYTYDQQQSKRTAYVQIALMELFQWRPLEDELILFLTPSAREKNWLPAGDSKGLERELSAHFRTMKIQVIDVSDQLLERDLWHIFDTISGSIDDGDQIILDITHSPRHVPFWGINVLDFWRTTKRIEHVQIVYGNLARHSVSSAVVASESIATIEDLSSMFYLMDWTSGVQSFLETGNTVLISRLVKRLKRRYRKSDESLILLERVVVALEKFSNNVALCRSLHINESANEIRQTLNVFLAHIDAREQSIMGILKPFTYLFPAIEALLSPLTGHLFRDQLFLAAWCVEKQMYQQSVTILSENITTKFTMLAFQDQQLIDVREYRVIADEAFLRVMDDRKDVANQLRRTEVVSAKRVAEERAIRSFRRLRESLWPTAHQASEMVEKVRRVKDLRNEINHAGFRLDPGKSNTLKSNIETCLSQWQQMVPLFEPYLLDVPSKKALLLLSHQLTPEQTADLQTNHDVSAIEYLPEPLQTLWSGISPHDSFSLSSMKCLFDWLLEQSTPRDLVIVQGEPAAVMAVVIFLQKKGYEPHYATSNRAVLNEQLEDERVRIERMFEHVQFRPYPKYWQLITNDENE